MHMDDKDIMARISDLIDTEHELRGQLARGELSSEQERERLRSAEEALDQCWDLLRQRRARRQYGENPDDCARSARWLRWRDTSSSGPNGTPGAPRESRGSGAQVGSNATSEAKEHRAYREVRQG